MSTREDMLIHQNKQLSHLNAQHRKISEEAESKVRDLVSCLGHVKDLHLKLVLAFHHARAAPDERAWKEVDDLLSQLGRRLSI